MTPSQVVHNHPLNRQPALWGQTFNALAPQALPGPDPVISWSSYSPLVGRPHPCPGVSQEGSSQPALPAAVVASSQVLVFGIMTTASAVATEEAGTRLLQP